MVSLLRRQISTHYITKTELGKQDLGCKGHGWRQQPPLG